jgi:hypothetical protein
MKVESKPEWMPINQNRTEPEWKDSEYTIKISRIKHREFEDGCQQTARKIVEWLKQLCITPNHIQCGLRRGCCPECIEQFCKEVGA